jgi:hypothetical protein
MCSPLGSSYKTVMSPTMVNFGNGERGATVILTLHREGTVGAIIFTPFMRHVPLTTL